MTEGTITRWLVGEGQACVKDQPLFEMETDKFTVAIDAPESGTLLKIIAAEGDTVPVAYTIGIIGNPGEDVGQLLEQIKAEPAAGGASAGNEAENPAPPRAGRDSRRFISPRAERIAKEKGAKLDGLQGTGPHGMIVERDILSLESTVKATPLAKKIAAISGEDISRIPGTGSHGKVTSRDVESFCAKEKSGGRDTLVPFTGMRRVIAGRMSASLQTAAQTYHRVCVNMAQAARLRMARAGRGEKISVNDIIVLAVSRALKLHPIMNAEFTKDGILLKGSVNIGIAVALDEGLVVPVIRDADLMDLTGIALASKSLSEKARSGALDTAAYEGGTFTVSNLGMFGLDEFVAIINPPEAGILAVGRIGEKPVAVNGEICAAPVMTLTLTYDHRIVDGAPAAKFLTCIKEYLEDPYLLI
jgi:pyruvate dehydrogenase E2 component (dihydrolipoamide acetyltransferase)